MMVCPKDKTHDEFQVTAHVTEDWVVDGEGNYVRHDPQQAREVLYDPDEQDIWTCATCGTEAISKAEGGE